METMLTTPQPSTSESATQPAETKEPAQTTTPSAIDWAPHVPKGSEKVFESFKGKSLTDVFNAHVEAQKLIGGSIRLPKPDATPEDRAKALGDIYNKLGRPETADKYDLGELPPLHDAVKWDDARLNAAKGELHKMGLSNDQAKGVLALFSKEVGALFPDTSAVAAKSREELITHYGSQAMFERNVANAQRPLKLYGDAETVAWLEQTGIGNSPAFIKLMAKIGKELVEHGAAEPASEVDYMSVKDAQDSINKVMNDKGDVYWSRPGTPGKDERVEEVRNWHRIVAGEV